MNKILICEDEDAIREFVIINLSRAGYEVTGCNCGEDTIEAFSKDPTTYGIVLLDVMLPGIDGFGVCKKIRQMNPLTGIIMLSAKSQEMDKVNGLMLGADDYITKPFSPSELLARIDALFRRVSITGPAEAFTGQIAKPIDANLISGPFVLNVRSRSLTKNDKRIDLTQVEFQIMENFMSSPNTAFERNELLSKVWGEGFFGDEKIVDVNMRRLRMKIEDEPSSPAYITTVWGFGYKWVE